MQSTWHTVYIALGSNIDSPIDQIQRACQSLSSSQHIRGFKRAELYHSAPMGPQDQPDFINTVVRCETNLLPEDVLSWLHEIERQQGRVKTRTWGERSIDLDLLLYEDRVLNHPHCMLPHPGIAVRAFVFIPLLQLIEARHLHALMVPASPDVLSEK